MSGLQTIRQSHLRVLEEQCPAMAYALNVEGLQGPPGPGAYRGTAIHDFFTRYIHHLYMGGRETDWAGVDLVLGEVLPRYPKLTIEQREDVIEQAGNIARSFIMRPERYYGCEEAFETEVPLAGGGRALITGRLDYLEVEDGRARIIDVKSNHTIWPDSRVRKDFQLRVYAMLVLDNLPQVEAVEGQLLMSRYGLSLPQRGEAVWDREDAQALKAHLGDRLAAHFSGKLKRELIPGTWCQYCPLRRPGRCSLYRSYYGTVPPVPLSPKQALRLARQVMALEDARELRLQLLKDYVNEHGPLAVGSGEYAELFAHHKRESEEIPASALLRILEDNFDLLGPQPLDELLTVNKRSKEFKALRRSEVGPDIDGAAELRYSTTFGHKSIGGEE